MVMVGARGTGAVVVVERGAGLGLRRVRLRDRLLARIRAAELDVELAAGTSPESSVALALHAGHLCEPPQRRLLARSLRRVVAAAENQSASRVKAPVCRPAVRRARSDLEAVIERLLAAGPVDVRGVARVRTLLADGGGPLYRGECSGHELRDELSGVLAALDVPA